MDNNLSTITPKRIMEILKEKTNSGVSRLIRIKINNPALFEVLGNPKNITEKLAEELIEWNNKLYNDIPSNTINGAIRDINYYLELLDVANSSSDYLDEFISKINSFVYSDFGDLLPKISINSKLTTRINNLKFLCTCSKKKNLGKYGKKYLHEKLIYEISYQRTYIHIFTNNMNDFMNSYFPLGLLLYDIPASDENRLNFLDEMKKIMK